MDKNSNVKFYRVNEEFGCFSNFSKYTVFFDGTFWKTSEYAFQAQKFLEIEHQLAVRAAETPMEAAKIGRDRSRPLRQDWEEVKEGLIHDIVFAKVMRIAFGTIEPFGGGHERPRLVFESRK